MSPTAFAVPARPVILLIPRSQTLTCPPNAANSFACHTSEKSSAKSNHCHTSKNASCKSFACHTSETPRGCLPPLPLSLPTRLPLADQGKLDDPGAAGAKARRRLEVAGTAKGKNGDVQSPLHRHQFCPKAKRAQQCCAPTKKTAVEDCNISVTIVIGWLSGGLSTTNKKVVVPIKPQEICKDSLTGARELH